MEQTPISKYLASLERRQALLTPSPAPDSSAIIRKINFDDDTFFHKDDTVLESPAEPTPRTKRRRMSILAEIIEEEDSHNKKMSDLERILAQTQAELIEVRALNTKFEHQICDNKRTYNEKLVHFEKHQNEIRAEAREATKQAETYKEQFDKLSRKEEELREKYHFQSESHAEKVSALETRLRKLESENLDLSGRFETGSLRQSDELRKLSVNLEETEMGAEKWVMETQLLREQLELKDKHLQKYQNELKEAQASISKYNELKVRYDLIKSPDASSKTIEEKVRYFENLYVRQQAENVRLIRNMEKIANENAMLRTSMNKEMLLEEQISTYEDDIKGLRAMLDAKACVEADKGILQTEITLWKTMSFKLDPDCTNPIKLEAFIRKLQNDYLEAKHEVSTLQLAISDRNRTITKVQSELNSIHEQVKKLTSENEMANQEAKKVNRRLSLVTKDRDGLKALKESYEQEFEGLESKPLQERIAQLEATVAEYEAFIQQDLTKKTCAECEKRMALISEIRAEMEKLKLEKAETEAQLANVSQMGDDGNTTGLKIVSFGLNPSTLTLEARLQELIKENESLKTKLKDIEDQSVLTGTSEETERKSKELEDKNKTLERKLEILTEAYDFETQQLQLIVNKLCGFHFTLVREPSVQIRLTSAYSHSPNEDFIFQESTNGDMLLLESPVLENFRADIDKYLISDGSIPGFLSSVTITYLQSQTSQDASQHPASQVNMDETATDTVSTHQSRVVEVEVERRRHSSGEEDEDEEVEEEETEEHDDDENEHDDEADDHENAEEEDEDDEDEGGGLDEGDEEEYDESDDGGHDDGEGEEDDEEQEESEDEREDPPIRRPTYKGMSQPIRGPPPGDESDDSDVIMID